MTFHSIPDASGAFPRSKNGDPAELFPHIGKWRSEGREVVARHYSEFEGLVAAAERQAVAGNHLRAAASLQVASNHAVIWHSGLFASARLESVIRSVGKAALPTAGHVRGRTRPDGCMEVLHVASRVARIGGGSRMLWRWVGQDQSNRHSVALTRQVDPLPPQLRDAITRSRGQIFRPNLSLGSVLAWARRLQAVIGDADLAVFHVDNFDVVPFLALAGMEERPPILLVNHSDHVFWVGAGFVDLVVNTRRSGLELCVSRRGIGSERNALMPLCLQAMTRTLSRASAKKAIGLPEDSVVLLTIARAVKYRTIGGATFADALVPVLCGDRRVHLIAVGPGGAADWSAAIAAAPGRIHLHPERPDTAAFLQAADIFVDSFPFPSITSLFEAGLYGLPLVTHYPFGPGCEVMGADSPGLDEVLVRTKNLSDYRAALEWLIGDPAGRAELGERTRTNIEAINTGEGWQASLDKVYSRAFDLAPVQSGEWKDTPLATDLDVFLPYVFGHLDRGRTEADRMASATEADLKIFPPMARMRMWLRLVWRQGFVFRSTWKSWLYLLPEWLTGRLKASLAAWR